MLKGSFYRFSALTSVVALTFQAACSDVAPRPDGRARTSVASARGSSQKEQLHRRNSFDWVGLAHNHAIEEFQKDMRLPKAAKGFCRTLEDFLAQPERVPAAKREANLRDRSTLARDAVLGVPGCQANAVKIVSLPGVAEPMAPQTGAAASLYDQVLSAVELSTNSTELASRLYPILDASRSLSSDEQNLIAITVSVAQNSVEFWESNQTSFAQDAVNRYGDCTVTQVVGGVSFDIALSHCLNSGFYDQPISGPPRTRPLGRMVGKSALPFCQSDPVPGIKKIGAADVKGAWSGFFSGAIVGGRAIEGALIGAAASSTGTALGLALQQFICIMTK